MFQDYGKSAYIKVKELEKKFEKLEKELLSSLTNTLSYDLVTPEKSNVFTKSFICDSTKTSTVTAKIDFESDVSLPVDYQITVNGNAVINGKLQDGYKTIDFQTVVGEGKVSFQLRLYSDTPFIIKKLFISLSGNLNYSSEFSRISVFTNNQTTYLSTVDRNKFTLYGYDEQGLSSLYELKDVKVASIAGLVAGELYVLYTDVNNYLRLLIYNVEDFHSVILNLNVGGVTSVCGYPYGEGIKIIYVITGKVYSGDYVKNGVFNGENTRRKGIKVYCDANCAGVYVISDAYNSNKLVTQSETIVLAKGINHHINKIQTGYRLTYSDKNVLYAQELNDRLNTPTQIGYCDEKIRLYDGNYLVRVRDSLKIRKD